MSELPPLEHLPRAGPRRDERPSRSEACAEVAGVQTYDTKFVYLRFLRASLLALGLTALAPGSALSQADDSAPETARPDPAPAEMETTAQRNENVPVYQLDTNEQQELNKRIGNTPEVIDEFKIEEGYYAAELGNSPSDSLGIEAGQTLDAWHGEFFEYHQNSVLNARTFFQVGSVQPSHQNNYGLVLSGPAGWLGDLTGTLEQSKVRGMVNGNVLVPLESERTPLATDPEVRAVIDRILRSYPAEPPNRADFDPRALNTNAPQRVDSTGATLRLDRSLGGHRHLTASYSNDRAQIDAFQFVAGQNADTEIHSHLGRLSHSLQLSPTSVLELGVAFQRTRSLLSAEPNAFDSEVRVGHEIEDLGPRSEFPIDRAQNSFTWGGIYTRKIGGGGHHLRLGANLTRYQLNGVESDFLRGSFQFSNSFGRSAIENLRYGTPSKFVVTLGDAYRGFRNWRGELFFGDDWRVTPGLQLTYGLRYEFETRPTEIQERNVLPYDCDCNNVAPRLALAYRFGTSMTVLRSSYTVSFGEIYPVTYQQIRNNPPGVRQYQIQNPDLLDPLAGVDLNSLDARTSLTRFSEDLVAPYSHQYNLSLEHRLGAFRLRWGYVGSRTFKFLKPFVLNRAELVPGIPTVPETIDERRPDPRFSEIYLIANAGVGYLDAAQFTATLPDLRGLAMTATYTLSKALDTGADFTSTASGTDLRRGRSQDQYDLFNDLKGPSDFDSPHSFLLVYACQLPQWSTRTSWLGGIVNGWTLSGTALAKVGTPFTVFIGSDSPGLGNVDGSGGERPNLLDPSILGSSAAEPDTSADLLRPDRFGFIGEGELRGNLGRGTFRKGPIKNMNLALMKQWSLGDRRETLIRFRLEAYNLTNSPQFDEPQRVLSSSSFGRITNTLNQGRVLQAGIRVIF